MPSFHFQIQSTVNPQKYTYVVHYEYKSRTASRHNNIFVLINIHDLTNDSTLRAYVRNFNLWVHFLLVFTYRTRAINSRSRLNINLAPNHLERVA